MSGFLMDFAQIQALFAPPRISQKKQRRTARNGQ
jgi:hypothetical protein